jgi:hypothetical protein
VTLIQLSPCGHHRVNIEVLAVNSRLAAAIHRRYGSIVHSVVGWLTAQDFQPSHKLIGAIGGLRN